MAIYECYRTTLSSSILVPRLSKYSVFQESQQHILVYATFRGRDTWVKGLMIFFVITETEARCTNSRRCFLSENSINSSLHSFEPLSCNTPRWSLLVLKDERRIPFISNAHKTHSRSMAKEPQSTHAKQERRWAGFRPPSIRVRSNCAISVHRSEGVHRDLLALCEGVWFAREMASSCSHLSGSLLAARASSAGVLGERGSVSARPEASC